MNRYFFKIMIVQCLMFLFIGCSAQSDIHDNAKLLNHNPVSNIYLNNLNNKLKSFSNVEMEDKKYIISTLKHAIESIKEISSKTDTSQFEREIMDLLKGFEFEKEVKRIIILSECTSGEVISCSEYIYVEYGNKCMSKMRVGLSDNLKSNDKCSTQQLDTLLSFLKSKDIVPDIKYREVFDSDKTFSIYEIKNNEIYANMFFYTWEYMELLDKIK